MSDWAKNGRMMLDNAKKHVDEADRGISAFIGSHPWSTTREVDEFTGDVHWAVHVAKQPDLAAWALAATDAVHNLRVGLDFLWRSVTRAKAGHRDVKFPFFEDTAQYADWRAKSQNRKHVPPGALAVLDEIKPYKAGNPHLAFIFDHDNTGKHTQLQLVTSAVVRVVELPPLFSITHTNGVTVPLGPSLRTLVPLNVPVEEGVRIYTTPAAAVKAGAPDPMFGFTIAFDHPISPRNLAANVVLHDLRLEVESIVNGFQKAGVLP